MKLKMVFFISFFFFYSLGYCQYYKGLYIDGFHQILGNQEKEDSLFTYIDNREINAIALYNLQNLDFSSNLQMNNLRSFINRAKTLHNVTEVAATAENAWFFENKIIPYNQNSNLEERFNVFNLEFEFWVPSAVSGYYCSTYLQPGGFTCDENGAFQFYIQELSLINSMASQNDCKTEVYLGWFNQSQIDQIKIHTDRILLSNYQSDLNNCFDVSLQRLKYIGNSSPVVDVAGLFSSEPDFLGSWLDSNVGNIDVPFDVYLNEYNLSSGAWKSNINLIGHHWFTYSTMSHEFWASIHSISDLQSLVIYPNPTKEYLYLKSLPKEIKVFDLSLKEITTQVPNSSYGNLIRLDLRDFNSGVYFIELDSNMYKVIKL